MQLKHHQKNVVVNQIYELWSYGMKVFRLYLLLALVVFSEYSIASNYEIIFREGSYEYNTTMPATSHNNKYLAKVLIKKDGVILNPNKTIRGSTLPDSWFFYEVWHGKGNVNPPNDNDIKRIFTEWEGNRPGSSDYNVIGPNVYKLLNDFESIIKKASYSPVIYSGKYYFDIGVHNNATSPNDTGWPYVPRLKGRNINSPYDGRDPDKVGNIYVGGYIKTINKNINQKSLYIANGINVHHGRRDENLSSPSSSKYSNGCLTINPSDWEDFYKSLPNIEEWKNAGHLGTITIIRPTIKSPPTLASRSAY